MSSLRLSRPLVYGGFLLAIFAGVLTAGSPWELNHGLMFAMVGGLMLISPPVARLPRLWWWLAGGFALCAALVFLPVGTMPGWRAGLEALGLDTGSMRAVQPRLAAEMLLVWVITLGVGLWIASQRTSHEGLKAWALVFALAVAGYALLSILKSGLPAVKGRPEVFGFFPNRNHSASLLAMGSLVAIAGLAQAIRDKRWRSVGLGVFATGLGLWALLIESESRGGLVLIGLGGVSWWLMLGRGYLGRHAWIAVLLLGLAIGGGFLVGSSKIRQRLDLTKEKLEALEVAEDLPGESAAAEASEARDLLGELDFRVPVWRDTAELIASAPLTGLGGGHYWGVFPQFRDQTLSNPYSDGAHPESDWLWIAAEAGIPAALFLLGLVVAAAGYGLRRARRQRAKALRCGCVVAALLLALHGLFDVPGHRVPLAWAAAFLFSLSLGAEEHGARRRPAAWPFRVGGGLVMAAGLYLLWNWWAAMPPPAVVMGERTRTELIRLYRLDLSRQKEARELGRSYEPSPEEDLLEQAMASADESLQTLPLDRSLWHWKGYLALHFDDRLEEVERAYALERALDPDWVGGPLRQARAWSPIDPQRTAGLWREALVRADRLDAITGGERSRTQALAEIKRMARGNEALEALSDQIRQED